MFAEGTGGLGLCPQTSPHQLATHLQMAEPLAGCAISQLAPMLTGDEERAETHKAPTSSPPMTDSVRELGDSRWRRVPGVCTEGSGKPGHWAAGGLLGKGSGFSKWGPGTQRAEIAPEDKKEGPTGERKDIRLRRGHCSCASGGACPVCGEGRRLGTDRVYFTN